MMSLTRSYRKLVSLNELLPKRVAPKAVAESRTELLADSGGL
jgi:hypothetical protein